MTGRDTLQFSQRLSLKETECQTGVKGERVGHPDRQVERKGKKNSGI